MSDDDWCLMELGQYSFFLLFFEENIVIISFVMLVTVWRSSCLALKIKEETGRVLECSRTPESGRSSLLRLLTSITWFLASGGRDLEPRGGK
jgi:hypothetical protein